MHPESNEECALEGNEGETEGVSVSKGAEMRVRSTPCGHPVRAPRAGRALTVTWIGSSHLVLSEMGPFVGLWENELLVLLRVFLALFPFC